jgi:hypothetical protein
MLYHADLLIFTFYIRMTHLFDFRRVMFAFEHLDNQLAYVSFIVLNLFSSKNDLNPGFPLCI